MSTRVQVILDEEEREHFRRQAEREGVSLSAWLRRAGRERLAAGQQGRITGPAGLKTFFEACDTRERGREPDWEEHRVAIEGSTAAGQSRT